jgi:glycosyltransferase involved in cell wall biosynthesis
MRSDGEGLHAKRVKVLHVITHLGVGGATDNTLMTLAGHRRDRYEVHLAAGILSDSDNYTEWRNRAEDAADVTFRLPDLRREFSPLADLRAIRALSKLIREQQYDVVHTHCSKAGFLGRIAARRASCPVVVHTCHAFAWQVADAGSKSTPRRLLSSAARRVFLQMDRYAATLSDALITVSDLNRKMAVAVGLAPAEKLTTIHSGIDLTASKDAPSRDDLCRSLGLDPSQPVVGTVGRLATQKDPLTFVRAAKLVLDRKPAAQFIMIGNGPLEREVKEAVGSDLGIRMLGHREDVREILTVLHAFVLSSRWEGLGRALTEAVGTGIPVAATAVDGIPELISHGVTGLLSPPGDAEALADNILWLLDHRDEALRMAERARTRVVREWGVDQMVQQIEALYEDLLEARGVSGSASPSSGEASSRRIATS